MNTSVPSAVLNEWIAFFACVAVSSALNIYLLPLVIAGPITWPILVTAIIATCILCFVATISPADLNSLSGDTRTEDRWGSWG